MVAPHTSATVRDDGQMRRTADRSYPWWASKSTTTLLLSIFSSLPPKMAPLKLSMSGLLLPILDAQAIDRPKPPRSFRRTFDFFASGRQYPNTRPGRQASEAAKARQAGSRQEKSGDFQVKQRFSAREAAPMVRQAGAERTISPFKHAFKGHPGSRFDRSTGWYCQAGRKKERLLAISEF